MANQLHSNTQIWLASDAVAASVTPKERRVVSEGVSAVIADTIAKYQKLRDQVMPFKTLYDKLEESTLDDSL